MPNWLTTIMAAVIAVIIALLLWRNIFGSDVDLKKEIDLNERTSAPDDQQLKWHIQHIRQDIMSITRILFWIFLVLLLILIKVFFQSHILIRINTSQFMTTWRIIFGKEQSF